MLSIVSYPMNIFILALVIASSESLWPKKLPWSSCELTNCQEDGNEKWSYRGGKGPENWGKNYPSCNGERQSPINIDTTSVVKDGNLTRMHFENYGEDITNATIENNGHTVEVIPYDGVQRKIMVNGDSYNLIQLHFHWRCTLTLGGSEHTINNRRYAMEMHLVHENAEGGTAVVALLLEEWGIPNYIHTTELQKIVGDLSSVRYKDDKKEFGLRRLNLNKLLPENPASYYRYDGSFTTPNCTEGVTWTVIKKPIRISDKQVFFFRTLSSSARGTTRPCFLNTNARPVQPLGNRTVYQSQ